MRESSSIILAMLTLSVLAASGDRATAFEVCWIESSCERYASEAIAKSATRPVPKQVERSKAKVATTKKAKPIATASTRPVTPPPMLPQVTHKVAIQINERNPASMERALDTADHVASYFHTRGETTTIEIVAYGPGLHMLRDDTSPVKERISRMSDERTNISFVACSNTQANQSRAEGKPISLLAQSKSAPSGVVHLMDLQEQGYVYLRP